MFAFLRFFRRTPRATDSYTWHPAVDFTDPRISAILRTFG